MNWIQLKPIIEIIYVKIWFASFDCNGFFVVETEHKWNEKMKKESEKNTHDKNEKKENKKKKKNIRNTCFNTLPQAR